MILDAEKFIVSERKFWEELEQMLDEREKNPASTISVDQALRFHYLYERTSADLNKIAALASERNTRQYLENLVARAYAEIHETRQARKLPSVLRFLNNTIPTVFRAHLLAFTVSTLATATGVIIGILLLLIDPASREVLLPFPHLMQDPSDRVKQEESSFENDVMEGQKASGAAWYFRHNTQVAIGTVAFGITWGVGTLILLFMNGVMLGAVVLDYVRAGETTFLAGWLLPHGSVEIPAILVAGQAGLVIASAMIGWERPLPFRARLRAVSGDVVVLTTAAGLMLSWAGFVEAFLSQYHEPVLPYWFKILFGTVELALLSLYFFFCGRADATTSGSKQMQNSSITQTPKRASHIP